MYAFHLHYLLPFHSCHDITSHSITPASPPSVPQILLDPAPPSNPPCSEDGKSTRCEFGGGWSEIRDGFAFLKGGRRREGGRDRKEWKGRSEAAGTQTKQGTSCYFSIPSCMSLAGPGEQVHIHVLYMKGEEQGKGWLDCSKVLDSEREGDKEAKARPSISGNPGLMQAWWVDAMSGES